MEREAGRRDLQLWYLPWMKQKEREGGKTRGLATSHGGRRFHETCVVEGAIQAKEGLSCVACSRVLEVIGVEWLCANEPVTVRRY
jgi:hypothetical protein